MLQPHQVQLQKDQGQSLSSRRRISLRRRQWHRQVGAAAAVQLAPNEPCWHARCQTCAGSCFDGTRMPPDERCHYGHTGAARHEPALHLDVCQHLDLCFDCGCDSYFDESSFAGLVPGSYYAPCCAPCCADGPPIESLRHDGLPTLRLQPVDHRCDDQQRHQQVQQPQNEADQLSIRRQLRMNCRSLRQILYPSV